MDSVHNDQPKQIEINFSEGLVLHVVKTIAQWINTSEQDYDLFINSLLPLEENETVLAELSIAEIAIQCLAKGILDKAEKKYDANEFPGMILLDLMKGIHNATFDLALLHYPRSGDFMRTWGLRRYKGKAVWAKRPPTELEKLKEKGFQIMDLRDLS